LDSYGPLTRSSLARPANVSATLGQLPPTLGQLRAHLGSDRIEARRPLLEQRDGIGGAAQFSSASQVVECKRVFEQEPGF
jgi:hypothetical protein